MTTKFLIQTILEFAVGGFLIWGVLHEDRLVAFEDRLFSAIRRRRLRVAQGKARRGARRGTRPHIAG